MTSKHDTRVHASKSNGDPTAAAAANANAGAHANVTAAAAANATAPIDVDRQFTLLKDAFAELIKAAREAGDGNAEALLVRAAADCALALHTMAPTDQAKALRAFVEDQTAGGAVLGSRIAALEAHAKASAPPDPTRAA
jgi:hypothetical protein